MGSIRALLVDDHAMYVEALAELMESAELVVVGTARTGREALRLADLHHPDLAVVDSVLDDEDGIELVARLRSRHPGLRLMVAAEPDGVDVASAVRALRAGARAFLPKAVPVSELVRMAQGVMAGETHIPPLMLTGILATLTQGAVPSEDVQDHLATLSSREFEVLELMAAGRDTAGIAEHLFLSPHTIRTHVKHILAKLEVHSSLEAVTLLLRAERRVSARLQNEGS
jgi:DNA-binding NarL/FixJ family response regulator